MWEQPWAHSEGRVGCRSAGAPTAFLGMQGAPGLESTCPRSGLSHLSAHLVDLSTFFLSGEQHLLSYRFSVCGSSFIK